MAETPVERSTLVETHRGWDPRLMLFYPAIAVLLLILVGGLAYQQLFRADNYHEQERQQTQRRILIPGPRGNIYDREGRLLVGNRPRFAVTLYLDELRGEFRREYLTVRKNYRDLDDKDIPNAPQLEAIARYNVVQHYLDQVNRALDREETVDAKALSRHFSEHLLLPYILLDDLSAEEYAKLVEQLPVRSPLQVYASSTRTYPFKSAAAHTLGYVTGNEDIAVAEDFPGSELTTFKMRGTEGKAGLEKSFETTLQGETGGSIYRVDPQGFRIEPPLARRLPVPGKDLTTSLDIDLQQVAENAMEQTEMNCATVMMDVSTGEELVLASKPDYDLNDTSPRLKTDAAKTIEEKGAWLNRAVQGAYAPGSSFKVLVSVAGMRAGKLDGDSTIDCPGFYLVGNHSFPCHDRHAHGLIDLSVAIEKSCNVFFYAHGLEIGPEAIAAEARRFGFGRKTGIELPYETNSTIIPDPEWKLRTKHETWQPGDTANFSIGQGYVLVSPLQMASFVASFARREVSTPPTLVHDSQRPTLHTEPIGLSVENYAAIVEGMEQCTNTGTGKLITHDPRGPIEGLRVAGKTGTAQAPSPKGTINLAWFICFAPIENPKIAMAIMVEGDTPGEETGGGRYAVPIAYDVLKAWWGKTNRGPAPKVSATTGT
ncbi:MAG TPA: penicillin-binding transpeptidase domain-containing protein [Opitutaceae bacterium]